MNLRKFNENLTKLANRISHWVEHHRLTSFLADHGNLAFFYGIFLFLYEISVLRDVVPAIHPFLIAWAGILFVYDVLVRRAWAGTPFWKVLLLFMVSAMVTAMLNIEAGIISNVKAWIMTILPLVTFYPVCIAADAAAKKKVLIKAFWGSAIVIFLSSSAAIAMYLARVSKTLEFMGSTITLGYRYYIANDPASGMLLYGLYKDTNHAAAYALVFAAYSIFLMIQGWKKSFSCRWINQAAVIFGAVNLAAQVFYFPLANSRGGWLSLIVSCTAVLFLFFFCAKFSEKKALPKTALSLAAAVCIVALLSGIMLGSRTLLSRISVATHTPAATQPSQNPAPSVPQPTISTDSATEPQTPPADSQGDSFSKTDESMGSGRLWIWLDVLKLYVKKPIMGNGPGNNRYYSEKYGVAPYSMGFDKAVHNSYLDLLLNYGIVGFVLLMAFWCLCVKSVLVKIFKKKYGLSYYLVIFSVLLPAITSLFLSSVFINTTAVSFIMFTLVGYLVSYEEDHAQ